MEQGELVIKNFKPRDNVVQEAERIIADELTELPESTRLKVAIVDQGKTFLISAVAATNEKIFNSESYHEKAKMWGFPRTWQIGALLAVVKDLARQIYLHKKMQNLFSLSSPKDPRLEIDE